MLRDVNGHDNPAAAAEWLPCQPHKQQYESVTLTTDTVVERIG